MSDVANFKANAEPTMGVELELMLIDPDTCDLAPVAVAIVHAARERGLSERVKLEITDSMIEINSSVQRTHGGMLRELRELRDSLVSMAHGCGASVCGGGTHPFHRWQERRLSPTKRFTELGHLYGYLAQQFTVFGQHIHIGCRDGDAAIRAIHNLSLFVPHFVALAGSSPFHRSTDTAFDSCRLNMIAAFPLSGRIPQVRDWREFLGFFERLRRLGVVGSIKDLYWDIRPKPEFGTIELRIPDTPLDVGLAADLAAYTQALVRWRENEDIPEWLDDFVYRHNRFQAARFGFDGQMMVAADGSRLSVRDSIVETIDHVVETARALGSEDSLLRLKEAALAGTNGAYWLRERFPDGGSLNDVVRASVLRWTEAS